MEFSEHYRDLLQGVSESLKKFSGTNFIPLITVGFWKNGNILNGQRKGKISNFTETSFDLVTLKETITIYFGGYIDESKYFLFPRKVKPKDYGKIFVQSVIQKKEKIETPLISLLPWTDEIHSEFLGSMRRPTLVVKNPDGTKSYINGVIHPTEEEGCVTIYQKSLLVFDEVPKAKLPFSISIIKIDKETTSNYWKEVSSQEGLRNINQATIIGWFEK